MTGENTFVTESEWKAGWVGTKNRNDDTGALPPELFQKKFRIEKLPERASLWISALGIYSAFLNGERAGDIYFAPGYTHYESTRLPRAFIHKAE
ncbi:MAG: alpha-L-rhamnosidase N-terminal domain-containing protein [Clostridium sp.]|nr:alpha-L-rhamnosidase N-terminal domain-containing protein [Clostridium sp.]